jgi:hypothetical protein
MIWLKKHPVVSTHERCILNKEDISIFIDNIISKAKHSCLEFQARGVINIINHQVTLRVAEVVLR